MKKYLGLVIVALFTCSTAFAGFGVDQSPAKVLGFASKLVCGAGTTCTMSGTKVTLNAPGTNGTALIAGTDPTFIPFPVTATTGVGTSTSGVATTLFLTAVTITSNATLTGIAINNGATVGTNKYIVALFNSAGVPIANSALAGVLTSGASAWQKVGFTATVAVTGPAVYFVGVYMNGATDNFFTIPAAGAYVGFTGTITGQTFGTIAAANVMPTTFTAGAGPIVYTY